MNKATQSGGVVFSEGGALAINIAHTSMLQNSAGDGGVLGLSGASATILTSHCMFADNVATASGGVIYSTLSSWDIQFLSGTILTGNSAGGSGGIIYSDILSSMSNLVLDSGTISANNAGQNGGVVAIFHPCDVEIRACVFSDNSAALSGAVLFVYQASVTVAILNTVAMYNVAASGSVLAVEANSMNVSLQVEIDKSSVLGNSGGAVALNIFVNNSKAAVSVSDSTFSDNAGSAIMMSGGSGSITAMISGVSFPNNSAILGGAIRVVNCLNFTVTSLSFDSNVAITNGGALMISGTWANVRLANLTILNNKANQGGGIFVVSESQVNGKVSFKDSTMIGNSAASVGGETAFAEVLDGEIDSAVFKANVALYGSAIYASGCQSTITGNIFSKNDAILGGTVFWENSLKSNLPYGFQINTFSANTAVYGDEWCSQPTTIAAPHSAAVNPVTNVVVPITVTVVDFFNNTVANNTQVISRSYSGRCSPLVPNVVGDSQLLTSAGSALFIGQTAYCYPNGNMTFSFSTTFQDSQLIPVGKPLQFPVIAETLSEFQSCQSGEYLKASVCVECPSGSFSLVGNPVTDGGVYEDISSEVLATIQCLTAPPNSDTQLTHGNQIWAQPGNWRLSPQAQTVISCPLGSTSCNGGNLTSDNACATGYMGPLCNLCEDGLYFSSASSSCIPCSNGVGIGFFVVPIILIFAAILYVSYGKLAKEILENFEARTKVKILVVLFQIVSAFPISLRVTFPASFQKFITFAMGWTNKLQFDISSFKCSSRNGIDFVDTLLVQTLTPLILCLVVFGAWKVHRYLIENNALGDGGDNNTEPSAAPQNYTHDDENAAAPKKDMIELIDRSHKKDGSDDNAPLASSIDEEKRSEPEPTVVEDPSIAAALDGSSSPSMMITDVRARKLSQQQMEEIKIALQQQRLSSTLSADDDDDDESEFQMVQKKHDAVQLMDTFHKNDGSDDNAPLARSTHEEKSSGFGPTIVGDSSIAAPDGTSSPPMVTTDDAIEPAGNRSSKFISMVSKEWRTGMDSVTKSMAKALHYSTAHVNQLYFSFFLYITFFVLPSVSTTIFSAFPCLSVNPAGPDFVEDFPSPKNFLAIDFQIECNSPRYNFGVAWASVMIWVYPIGIPTMYAVILYKNRFKIIRLGELLRVEEKIQDGDDDESKNLIANDDAEANKKELETVSEELKPFEFLFGDYKPCFWYWELLETMRRLLLTAVLSVVVGIIFAVVFIRLYVAYTPFDSTESNVMQEWAQFQVFFTLFGALLIGTNIVVGNVPKAVGGLLILVNVCTPLLTLFFVINKEVADKEIDLSAPTEFFSKLLSNGQGNENDAAVVPDNPQNSWDQSMPQSQTFNNFETNTGNDEGLELGLPNQSTSSPLHDSDGKGSMSDASWDVEETTI